LLQQSRMLIQRCAWHAFFRGYPRPLRVLSWRGRGVSFSDSICPGCADRVRIEGLWGTPPPPVWPGSPQTALIFVGLPLLTALVLLATPLHDPGPPAPRAELTAALSEELPAAEMRVAERATGAAALPRAVAKRQRTDELRVPAVIYETRRTIHRSVATGRASNGGSEPITLASAAATARAGSRPIPLSLGTQSP
jgi:hypothetical protein